MIPKIIHYCWFGNKPLPEHDRQCIETWKKYCPDYEIKCWNESNYDLSKCKYMLEAYNSNKLGFVPDYARLDIIYNHGGIYLDTDVILEKSFDDLLINEGFAGFESNQYVNLGQGFGAEKGNKIIKALMDSYDKLSFISKTGEMNLTASPILNSKELCRLGFNMNGAEQCVSGFKIYPKDYFCPLDYSTGILHRTEKTYSIHTFNGSWLSEETKRTKRVSQFCNRHFGVFAEPIFKVYKYLLHPSNLVKRLQKGKSNGQ